MTDKIYAIYEHLDEIDIARHDILKSMKIAKKKHVKIDGNTDIDPTGNRCIEYRNIFTAIEYMQRELKNLEKELCDQKSICRYDKITFNGLAHLS